MEAGQAGKRGRKRKRGRKKKLENGDTASASGSIASSADRLEELAFASYDVDAFAANGERIKRKYERRVLPPPSDMKTRGLKLVTFGAKEPMAKRVRRDEENNNDMLAFAQPQTVTPVDVAQPQEAGCVVSFESENELNLNKNPLQWSVAEVVQYVKHTDSAHLARVLRDQVSETLKMNIFHIYFAFRYNFSRLAGNRRSGAPPSHTSRRARVPRLQTGSRAQAVPRHRASQAGVLRALLVTVATLHSRDSGCISLTCTVHVYSQCCLSCLL